MFIGAPKLLTWHQGSTLSEAWKGVKRPMALGHSMETCLGELPLMNKKFSRACKAWPFQSWITWVLGVVALALIFLLGLSWHFSSLTYRRIFERGTHVGLRPNPAAQFKIQDLDRARPAAHWLKEKTLHLQWALESRDRLKLVATYVPAPTPSKRLVILLHGYRGVPEDLSEIARLYNEQWNYHVLLPASRAHGESGGETITLGHVERFDLSDWVEEAVERLGEDCEIVLHGFSMGAATVLLAGGERLAPQVKALVSDSSYVSLKEELRYAFERVSALPSSLCLKLLDPYVFKKLGFHLEAVSPKRSLMKCPLPTLLLHNYDDPVVPVSMTYELAEVQNLSPTQLEVKIFSKTGHCRAFFTDNPGYLQMLSSFLSRNMDGSELEG